MSKRLLQRLISHLELQQVEKNVFVGESVSLGWHRVFGGQIMAQTVGAAQRTVDENRLLHSSQMLFFRPGDTREPISYHVRELHDSGSFSFRGVTAYQKDHAICEMNACFQKPEEGKLSHQDSMPYTALPDSLRKVQDHYKMDQAQVKVPPPLEKLLLEEQPLEIKPVIFENYLNPKRGPPITQYWLRLLEGCGSDQPESIHQTILAYCVDHGFLNTALRPHGISVFNPMVQSATLSHSIYFHRPLDLTKWHLYDIDSSTLYSSRGLVNGKIYSIDGDLVASTVQEGLLRIRN